MSVPAGHFVSYDQEEVIVPSLVASLTRIQGVMIGQDQEVDACLSSRRQDLIDSSSSVRIGRMCVNRADVFDVILRHQGRTKKAAGKRQLFPGSEQIGL
jgi:hypothetical protein